MPVTILDDIDKKPNAELWYGFDLGALGYLATGATISEAVGLAPVWTITEESGVEDGTPDPVALVTDDARVDASGTQLLVRLTGGTDGLDYIVTGKWTTTPGGDVDERAIRIRCRV